jgi:hypothetical protein
MSLFRKKEKQPVIPQWALGVDSCAWIDDHDEVIDGIQVRFTKPGWSWTILREDLPYGPIGAAGSRIVDMGPADTREEALTIGLVKLREHQAKFAKEVLPEEQSASR